MLNERSKSFAWFIVEKRNERTFQELLDLLYYEQLFNNRQISFFNRQELKINISFENIFNLIDDKYLHDFEIVKETEHGYYEVMGKKTEALEFSFSKQCFIKKKEFFEKYSIESLANARRDNIGNILYFNLLFEVYFYEEGFRLPALDFKIDDYTQFKDLPE